MTKKTRQTAPNTYPGGRSKLTNQQIAEVRGFANERARLLDRLKAISNEELARVYNVSPTTISACINYYYSYRNNKRPS